MIKHFSFCLICQENIVPEMVCSDITLEASATVEREQSFYWLPFHDSHTYTVFLTVILMFNSKSLDVALRFWSLSQHCMVWPSAEFTGTPTLGKTGWLDIVYLCMPLILHVKEGALSLSPHCSRRFQVMWLLWMIFLGNRKPVLTCRTCCSKARSWLVIATKKPSFVTRKSFELLNVCRSE